MSAISFDKFPPEGDQLRLKVDSYLPDEPDTEEVDASAVDIFAAFGVEDDTDPKSGNADFAEQESSITVDAISTSCADNAPGQYIAFLRQGRIIWGLGTTPDEARKDAENNWTRVEPMSEQPMFIFSPASRALVQAVKTYGGNTPWENNDGLAVRVEDPKSAPIAKEEDAIPASRPAQDAEITPATAQAGAQDAHTSTTNADASQSVRPGTDAETADSAADPKTGAVDAEAPATGDIEDTAPTAGEISETSGAISTDAGLIDPETGENLDPSLIFRKFGWTEMPHISKDSTKEEIELFEARLDEVLDRCEGHTEKAARYRAQAEARCKPLDGAAKFYTELFIIPMAKALGPHKLHKNKKGEYKSKTMALASGSIKFTQIGGASVHDAALVKAHIGAQGLDKFKSIGAKREVTYDYAKLLAALNKGTLKNIPGTVLRDKDPFAKVTVVRPGAAAASEEE